MLNYFMFSAILVENRVIIDDKDAANKIHKKGDLELIDKKLYLTVVERYTLLRED